MMEEKRIYDVELVMNGEPVFGYYKDDMVLIFSDVKQRFKVLKHLEAAAEYLRETLSPATE